MNALIFSINERHNVRYATKENTSAIGRAGYADSLVQEGSRFKGRSYLPEPYLRDSSS